jgi:hypothetical protein
LREKGLLDKSCGGGRGHKSFHVNSSHIIIHAYLKCIDLIKTKTPRYRHKTDTLPDTNLSSKIDSINFKKNLSNYLETSEVGKDVDKRNETKKTETWFMNLDFSAVSPIKATHVNSSIRNLVQATLNPDDVQSFLNRYKSWMTTQDISKIKNPIALFCEKLKEFATFKKSDVEDSITDEERQTEVEFMISVNKAKAEMDMIKKAKSNQDETEWNEYFESHFNEWYEQSSEQEKLALSQPSSLAPFGSAYYKLSVKASYKENIFTRNVTRKEP